MKVDPSRELGGENTSDPRAGLKPMARAPKMARERFPWHAAFPVVPLLLLLLLLLFLLTNQRLCIVYIHTHV